MKRTWLYCFLLSFESLFISMPLFADSLGQLFTNEQERKRLDYIRNQKDVIEKPAIVPANIDSLLEPKVEETVIIKDAIKIKGIVKRGDGKNSAWVNDSNTYEGDLDTLYINVSPEGIGSDKVIIKMPDNETEVEIKVGESYDPNNSRLVEAEDN